MIHFATDLRSGCPKPFRRGKKGTYCIRQRIGGKDVWRSLRTTDKKEADYLAGAIWRSQQSGLVRSLIPVPPMPLGVIWTHYVENEKFKLLTESSRYKRTCTWRNFAEFCQRNGLRYATEINRTFVEKWLVGNGTRLNHTYNNMLSELNAIFQQIAPEENPCAGITRKSTTRGDKRSTAYAALTRSEIAQIFNAVRHWRSPYHRDWLDALTVALHTGARYEDIACLQYTSINHDAKGQYLAFSPHKTANATGGKVVYIRMTPRLVSLLDRRRAQCGGLYVFPHFAEDYAKGAQKAVTTNKLNEMLRTKGIKGSFHCFRATVITAAARAGVDLKDFGGVVGHTTEAQTQAYNRAALDIDLNSVVSAI